MIRYKFFSGDVNWQTYGGKFISQKLNNGDFDYWLIMDVINMWDATGDEEQAKYIVEIHAISPQAVLANDPTELNRAFESCGIDPIYQDDPMIQVEALEDYGILAMLKSFSGNNLNNLMKEARKESQMIDMLFGFYMDRQENRIGQDGWGLIAGQDIREFLKDNYPE